jgi:hypothetical protein
VLALVGCGGDDESALEEQASSRASFMSENPDSPAPPLSDEEATADLTELMTDQEQLDLMFNVEMSRLFWEESTEAERQDACSVPAEIPAAAELTADQWLDVAAENDLDVERDWLITLAQGWFEEQCALVTQEAP